MRGALAEMAVAVEAGDCGGGCEGQLRPELSGESGAGAAAPLPMPVPPKANEVGALLDT